LYCVVGSYAFTLYLVFHLNVQDHNDEV